MSDYCLQMGMAKWPSTQISPNIKAEIEELAPFYSCFVVPPYVEMRIKMNILMLFSINLVLISSCTATRLKRGFLNNEVVLLNFNNEQVTLIEPNQNNLLPQNSLDTTSGSGVELGRSTPINYQHQQLTENQQVQLAESRSLNLARIENQQPIQKNSITQQIPKERTIQDGIFESIQTGNRILNGQIIEQPQSRQSESPNPQTNTIAKQAPLENFREIQIRVPVEVPKPYEVRVPHPVPVPVAVRVPIEIPKPYPVTVTKTVHVPVEKIVYIQVPQPIKIPVPEPYPVPVPQPVPVNVPTPVLINDNPTPVNSANTGENINDDSIIVEARSGPVQGTTVAQNHGAQGSNNQQTNILFRGTIEAQGRSATQNSNRQQTNALFQGTTVPQSNQQVNVVPVRPLFRSSQQLVSNPQLISRNEPNYLPQIPQIYQVVPLNYLQSQIW